MSYEMYPGNYILISREDNECLEICNSRRQEKRTRGSKKSKGIFRLDARGGLEVIKFRAWHKKISS